MKVYPSGIEFLNILCVSKCDYAEAIVVVAATPSVVEIEHSCIGRVVVIASTFEERISQVRKVRVVTV